jgi:predicted amidophosphoribosyltransferase
MTDARRCPACRAPWRALATCPRCGADLAPLMRLAARAWALRETARAALLAGGAAEAVAMARAAYALERTPRAQRLLALALIAGGDAGARALIAVEADGC